MLVGPWTVHVAHPTGRLTRHGLTERAWKPVRPGYFADCDASYMRRGVDELADLHGSARATNGVVTITRMRDYRAVEVLV